MTKSANTQSIEQATGKAWSEWVEYLESQNAADKSHKEIAELVHKVLNIESAGWWAQAVTVAYEQHIGRRTAGQRNDGSFEVSVSRTVEGSRDDVFAKLQRELDKLETVTDSPVANRRISITPVRSYWRCDLGRGDKVSVAVEVRAPGKVAVVTTQTNLKSQALADDAKLYWKAFLSNF